VISVEGVDNINNIIECFAETDEEKQVAGIA